MNVGEVVEHILTVLRSPRMVVWLCGDYSQILLHHILLKPHHVVQISASSWNGEMGDGGREGRRGGGGGGGGGGSSQRERQVHARLDIKREVKRNVQFASW